MSRDGRRRDRLATWCKRKKCILLSFFFIIIKINVYIIVDGTFGECFFYFSPFPLLFAFSFSFEKTKISEISIELREIRKGSIIFPRGSRESVLYSRSNLVSGHVRRDSRGLYRHRGIEFIRESA